MTPENLVGGLGVTLLVAAFILNAMGRISVSYAYTLLNLVGAAMAAVASAMIGFVPFVVLEAIWFVAAGIKLVSLRRADLALAGSESGTQ